METAALRKVDFSYIKRNNGVVHPIGFGVMLCTRGTGRVGFNGMIYTLEKNVLLLFKPYSIVNLEYGSDDVEGLIFETDVQTTMMMLSDISVEKRLALSQHPCVRISDRQASIIMNLEDILQAKYDEVADDSMGFNQKMKSYLSQSLCYQFMQIYFTSSQVEGTPAKRSTQIFNKFIGAVYISCASQRTVSYYADLQNISTGHFASAIRNVSGHSPMHWIELFTMTKIRRMLIDTALSLKEIADLMNFPDQSTFGRYFKQREKISPSDYRAANKV